MFHLRLPRLVLVSLGILAGCDEREEHEYRAQLADDGERLVLHAADGASPEFQVWLEGDFAPETGCPQFELTATLNGVPLALQDAGGLGRLRDSDHKITIGQRAAPEHCYLETGLIREEPTRRRPLAAPAAAGPRRGA
jgi:hypothetical protein